MTCGHTSRNCVDFTGGVGRVRTAKIRCQKYPTASGHILYNSERHAENHTLNTDYVEANEC